MKNYKIPKMNIPQLTLKELSQLFHSGTLTSREIAEAFIAEIEAKDGDIHAFITTTFDLAREMADSADSRFSAGKLLSPIDGMPIALKDAVCTEGIRTTACSRVLENFIPPYNAMVWQKLKDAGAVLLGKTNTDEFTMGASTENSAFGVTKNPHDFSRVAGGSSGGSAAAVAANMCAAAIGTDTGGSIRQPASFCGCTGLKVSYGRVSRWGTIPMASSLDTIGPLAKTPEDCAMILEVIAGNDSKDSTTPSKEVVAYSEHLNLPKEYFIEGTDSEVVAVVSSTQKILESLGAKIIAVSLPHTKYALPVYYIVVPSEVSANMSRFDGIRFGTRKGEKNLEEIYTESREYGFGDEVKRRILIGTYALSAGYYDAFYRKAQNVRTLLKRDFETVFEQVDILLTPVSPTPAFKIGENSNDPLKMYLEDVFTTPASLAGICGISVPMGQSKDNLPIGVQLLGAAFSEASLLNVAHQIFEKTKN